MINDPIDFVCLDYRLGLEHDTVQVANFDGTREHLADAIPLLKQDIVCEKQLTSQRQCPKSLI